MSNTLGHIMTNQGRAHPDRVALVELETGSIGVARRLSYRDLDNAMDRVAAGAAAAELRPGDRVLLAMRNRADLVTLAFGLMRAGVVPAIVNPRLSADDFNWFIDDLDPTAVIVDEVSIANLAEAAAIGRIDRRFAVGDARNGWRPSDQLSVDGRPPAFVAAPDDLAMILYTSGSTGRPKGVLLPHGGQLDSFNDQRRFYDGIYTRPPVNLIAAPMFHKNGVGNVKTAFATGGTAIIMPRFDPELVLRAIPAHGVTTFTAVATMLTMMLAKAGLIESLDFGSLDSIMVGAAPTGRVLLDEVERRFGARVFHMFGTTEGGASFGHDPKRRYSLDSCGRPLPGVEAKLVGPEGEGDEGELWVRSPGVAQGYRNRPDAEAERFRPGGWYATGDILSRDPEGFYFFRGRTDDMFVCGGENIYPMEVERLLLLHPGVAGACVAAVPHPSKGQVPAAAVVRADPCVGEAELKDWCLANGPAYAHPRYVRFEDALPVAPTGKIDRRTVAAQLVAEAPARFAGLAA